MLKNKIAAFVFYWQNNGNSAFRKQEFNLLDFFFFNAGETILF